jgi:hypothetical protein
MTRFKSFVKRNNLWAGFVAVFIPLLIMLSLQYWSLVRLEKLSPVADKWKLKDFLWTLSTGIQDHYQTQAKELLNIPPRAFSADA